MDGIPYHGRSDAWIIAELSRRAGVEQLDGLRERYFELLPEELAARSPFALPGTRELLDALLALDGVAMGLGTGNLRRAAFIKLEAVGLGGYFEDGGFGDDHEERSRLLEDGARALGWSPGDGRVVVIGDTEHDVTAGHAIGAFVLGVATGTRSAEELRVAGADEVVADLTETVRLLPLLVEGTSG